jgi:hypothetical protein
MGISISRNLQGMYRLVNGNRHLLKEESGITALSSSILDFTFVYFLAFPR